MLFIDQSTSAAMDLENAFVSQSLTEARGNNALEMITELILTGALSTTSQA